MQTPDGKDFNQENGPKPLDVALRAMLSAVLAIFAAIWKFIITTWRLAAALDSALWRATKLVLRKALEGLVYAGRLAGRAFHSLILWLPTRTGRAYSAFYGVFLVVGGLWIIDELRTGARFDEAGQSILRPPIDEEDPILARIEGRYVHLSEIEAAARAGGFLRDDEILTPMTAFNRGLVEAYVEQRLLARAALDEGMQRAPTVLRKINAARDRVLAASFIDARISEDVTPETVERFYQSQRDVTVLGDEVRARHILVATGKEAEEIIAAINAGADFGALAREKSLDRATAPLGGEIGWFTRSMMTPVLSNAAFSTKKGQLAPPFQTEFGWHVLQVLDRRSTRSVPFEEVKDNIETFLRDYTIDRMLKSLSEESQVVYFRPDPATSLPEPPPPDLNAPELYEEDGSAGDAAPSGGEGAVN